MIGTQRGRVIDAQITIKTSDGTRTSGYRLITTLLDAHRYPAGELITIFHQRWEIETAYLEIKSSILGGRISGMSGPSRQPSSRRGRADGACLVKVVQTLGAPP